jgi:hypothetical protein
MGRKSRIKAQRRAEKQKQSNTLDPNIPRPPPKPKSTQYISNGNDLFDNPMTRAAISALSEEQKEKYRRIGEAMYSGINFEDQQSLNNMPPPMSEAVAYLESQIQSGLHPSMLEANEKAILADAYGEKWYEKWGYVEQDLTDIFTV